MTQLHLVLALACVTGAVATTAPTAPERSAPALPAAGVTPATASGVSAGGQPDVAWVARYGTYNVRQGSWNLVPHPNARGC